MNKNIYLLKSNTRDYSFFLQKNIVGDGISKDSIRQKWIPFSNYDRPIQLDLMPSDLGKKNYQLDISSFLSPFFIFSQDSIDKLNDILLPRGQLMNIMTESKRKKFYGFYLTNPLSGCFDREKSTFREYPKGLMIEKVVLISSNITDEYIFSIEEDISRVFVTDAFIKRVKDANLKGFDFSRKIETR